MKEGCGYVCVHALWLVCWWWLLVVDHDLDLLVFGAGYDITYGTELNGAVQHFLWCSKVLEYGISGSATDSVQSRGGA
jgi:hypothetical protein